jgi:hypothetical protein
MVSARVISAEEQPELKISRSDRAFSTKNEFSLLKTGSRPKPFGTALKFAGVDASNPKTLFTGVNGPANPVHWQHQRFLGGDQAFYSFGNKAAAGSIYPSGHRTVLTQDDPIISRNG